MNAWLMEGEGAKDEDSTLVVPVFLMCLEDRNEVAAKIFDRGGGEDDIKEVISKGGRGEFNDMAYYIQSGNYK